MKLNKQCTYFPDYKNIKHIHNRFVPTLDQTIIELTG